jgi:hypothetical protein
LILPRKCNETMSSLNIKPKEMIEYFFSQCNDKILFLCNDPKCGGKVKQKLNTGYTNLKNHLRSCVGKDFEQIYLDIVKSCKQKGRLDSYGFVNEREKEGFKILNWIVQRNQPLNEINNEITRDIVNVKPISSKTLQNIFFH